MNRYPIIIQDTMDCYIAFATKEDASWYEEAWPKVGLEDAFDEQGNSYMKIMRDKKQVGIRWHYD